MTDVTKIVRAVFAILFIATHWNGLLVGGGWNIHIDGAQTYDGYSATNRNKIHQSLR
jgi:hypothetical protein